MPRCGRLRSFIRQYGQSIKTKKFSFIIPYLILSLEVILLIDAAILDFNPFIIVITLVLVGISVIEIILVSREIHKRFMESNFEKILTIRLDDFVTETKEKNVKKTVSSFIEKYPEYTNSRNEIYHTTCQILETHKEEEIEKEIENKLKPFIKRNKKANVDETVDKFLKKYPKYKSTPSLVYEKTCFIMGISEKKD